MLANFKSRIILVLGDTFPWGYLGKQQVFRLNLNNIKTDGIDSNTAGIATVVETLKRVYVNAGLIYPPLRTSN